MAYKEEFTAGSGAYDFVRPITKAQRTAFGLPEHGPNVDRLWLEVDFAPGWRAAYFLVPYGGQPVVAEIRIIPADEFPARPAGAWRAQFLGSHSGPAVRSGDFQCPPIRRGITARLLRRVPLGVERKHAAEFLSRFAAEGTWVDERFRAQEKGADVEKRGRPGRPDRFYASLARDYVLRCNRGSRRPVAEIADRRGLSAAIVRDAIHEARERGLLSPGRQGTPGGQLTPRGQGLLRSGKGKR